MILLQTSFQTEEQVQQHVDNALNGYVGEALDSLIVFGETMLWGGTTATGDSVPGAGGLMIGTAAALGAIFAVILAGKMAYQMMTKGKGIDVLELLKPITIAFVLANWYAVTSGLYHIFKPIENRFKSVYVWSNDRVDSLRDRRMVLLEVVEGEIEDKHAEAIISEVRQRKGINQKSEEEEDIQVQDGDPNQVGMGAAYTDGQFGDVLNDDVSDEPDDEKQGNFSLTELFNIVKWFHLLEDGIIWVGEVIWAVSLYSIFIIKYLFAYVLIMFGPIWIVCSILDGWSDSWSKWLGKYVVVGMYGTAAYMALIFGLMIIEACTVGDINSIEYAMLDDERFAAYIESASTFDSLADLALYVTAVIVTAVTLGMSFEIAGLVFPGSVGRAAGEFFTGMQKYIVRKAEQAQELAKEVAVSTAVTIATGSAATAAVIAKKLAERHEQNREKDDVAHLDKDSATVASGDKDPDDGGDAPAAHETRFKTRDEMEREYKEKQENKNKDEWTLNAEKHDKEAKAQAAFEESLGGPNEPTVMLNRMAKEAHCRADREAYLTAFKHNHRFCSEDIMADIRDRNKLEEAEKRGYKEEWMQLYEARKKENIFLLEMVMHQGLNTNNSLTAGQKMAIKLLGESKAAKYYDKSIGRKQLHGTPRLTSWGALLGLDTTTSPKAARQMLKNLGIYRDVQRAELLRRMANSYLAPRIRPARKFMGITVSKAKPQFRSWLHKKLYYSCMKNIAATEALIALRCRGILMDRDIHVTESGRAIHIPNADLYWRKDVDLSAYHEAMRERKAEPFHNEDVRWFFDRYGNKEEARKMQLELEVFEAKRRAADADDFLLERQLKARDEREIQLWQSINKDYRAYNRVKQQIDKMVESLEKNK